MFMRLVVWVLVLIAGAAAANGFAASSPGLADPKPGMVGNGYTNPLSSLDLEKIHDMSARDRAKAREQSQRIVDTLHLACGLTAVERIGRSTLRIDGKTVPADLFEVACDNATGYLLESRGSLAPLAISCFAAEAGRVDDEARGVRSEVYCQLPQNKDVKAMAAALMKASGTDCSVANARWFGVNAAKQMEYSEVACADGTGYLLRIAMTGDAPVSALGCREAAKEGLRCHLTDGGPVPVPITKQTFRDALKRYDIGCEPTELRIVGRESEDKRYVVEVKCPELPKGLVAFVPLEGNPHQFEAIDCAAASERAIACQL
jgi:hypothetical protein